MGLFDFVNLKAKSGASSTDQEQDAIFTDVAERPGLDQGVQKTYIPNFLYKPPYGYPRSLNVPEVRNYTKNPYIFGVKKRIKDEVAYSDWSIDPRDKNVRIDERPELLKLKKQITNFLENPNGNKESFSDITLKMMNDLLDLDSGVWNKVFDKKGELNQLFAVDGGTILMNPDIHGYIGNRAKIIYPDRGMDISVMDESQKINYYDLTYKNQAAYFQYGWTAASLPVPFGKDELIYFSVNPLADSVYGQSPIQLLADIIQSLVYGSLYNLDFYQNSNIPEGIISIIGGKHKEIKSFFEKFNSRFTTKDNLTGLNRKVGYKAPVTGYDVKFTPFLMSSHDMEIIAQQEWFTKIVWYCFGVSADDLGFSAESNKAVSEAYDKKFVRKAARPYLRKIEERINMEIIPAFGTTELKFSFDDYDLDEDIKKHSLYDTQIRIGIKTAEMVAAEEGIDLSELEKSKEKSLDMKVRENEAINAGTDNADPKNSVVQNGKKTSSKNDEKDNKPNREKAIKAYVLDEEDDDPFENTKLEKQVVQDITASAKKVKQALKLLDEDNDQLNRIA